MNNKDFFKEYKKTNHPKHIEIVVDDELVDNPGYSILTIKSLELYY